jgi:hypothetical protein
MLQSYEEPSIGQAMFNGAARGAKPLCLGSEAALVCGREYEAKEGPIVYQTVLRLVSRRAGLAPRTKHRV